jgi:hypothetical protein
MPDPLLGRLGDTAAPADTGSAPSADPWVWLWRSVVCVALRDMMGDTVGCTPAERRHARAAARRWLLEPNEDFPSVCAMADLDASAVRAGIKRRLQGR